MGIASLDPPYLLDCVETLIMNHYLKSTSGGLCAASLLLCVSCESSSPTDAERKYEDELVEFRVPPQRPIPGEDTNDTLYLLVVRPNRFGGTPIEFLHYLTTTEDGEITHCSTMVEYDGELRGELAYSKQGGYVHISTTDGHWGAFDLDGDGGMDIMIDPNHLEGAGCACLFYRAGEWVRGTHSASNNGRPRADVGEQRYEFVDGLWREAPGAADSSTSTSGDVEG